MDAIRAIPRELLLPARAVIVAVQHAEMFPIDRSARYFVLDSKIRVSSRAAEGQRLLVFEGHARPQECLCNQKLGLGAHSQALAGAVDQAFLQEQAALGLWELEHPAVGE